MVDTENLTSEADVVKPPKEILVVQDEGFFEHDTGDTYSGFFEAKKKDRSVKMHGTGVYKTAEGDVYSGHWDNDRLGVNDEVTIIYTDNSKYIGMFKDWSYSGRGSYHYPDNSILKCDFVDNAPVGNLTLIDPNGHTWLGKAENGFGWLEPINHYYDMLEKTKDNKTRRDRQSVDSDMRSATSRNK